MTPNDDDIPEVPDYLPEDLGDDDPWVPPAPLNRDGIERTLDGLDDMEKMLGTPSTTPNPFSDMIGLVTGKGQVLTLEAARMMGGDPIDMKEVEGIPPEHQAAFMHTEFTLAGMLALSQRKTPYPNGVDPALEDIVRQQFAERTEILVRLQRIRMRGEIKSIRASQGEGPSDDMEPV